jgi:UDP:flavonoid glycosyltransferase YjiC (YdhE family)
MRVLVVSVPAAGHFNPLVPLALALRDAGDDVLVASAPSVVAAAGAVGLAGARVGPEVDEWFGVLRSHVRGTPGDGLRPERILSYFTPRLFGECGAPLMADDLVPLVTDWQPDLIVYEATTFAAPLAGATAGVPSVAVHVSPQPPIEIWELCGDAVSSLWRSFGLTAPPLAGLFEGLALSTWPAPLDTVLGYEAFEIGRLRPVPYDTTGPEGLPQWMADLPERPIVYMTLGTVTNTDVSVFRAVLDGLADENVNVIVTVGRDNDPAMVGAVPQNARVERFIPQSLLLGSCAAVISHGGSGTTLAALSHGLPQLLIPQGADQFVNAERCEQAGVATRLLPEQVTADAVRARVVALLAADSPFGRDATRLQAEVMAMPLPEACAARLRRFGNS